MQIIKIITIISTVTCGTVRRVTPAVKLYSMGGHHLSISHSGRVSATRKVSSPLADLQMISVGSSEFIIRGLHTGLYITKSTRRNSKLKSTSDPAKAVKFSEEVISENRFNKYKIGQNCHLSIKRNGKSRISCRKNEPTPNYSILPRKTHQRVHRGSRF